MEFIILTLFFLLGILFIVWLVVEENEAAKKGIIYDYDNQLYIDLNEKKRKRIKKYKLFIKKYNVFKKDYIVEELEVLTDDIYHEVGKIYCTSIEDIKRISYFEIKE